MAANSHPTQDTIRNRFIFALEASPCILVAEIIFPLGLFKMFGWSWEAVGWLGLFLFVFMFIFTMSSPEYLTNPDGESPVG